MCVEPHKAKGYADHEAAPFHKRCTFKQHPPAVFRPPLLACTNMPAARLRILKGEMTPSTSSLRPLTDLQECHKLLMDSGLKETGVSVC